MVITLDDNSLNSLVLYLRKDIPGASTFLNLKVQITN